MQIICPECQFAREVDETKIPERSQVATCPKCQTKFKFRELPEENTSVEQPPATPATENPEADVKPAKPTQATLPLNNAPEPTFPEITAPGEDPKQGLWDKLDDMAPPEKNVTEPKQPEAAIREPEPATRQSEVASEPQPETTPEQQPVEDQQPVDGWTGQFNSDFPDPMQFEQEEEEHDESTMLVPPPFEQLDRYGFFRGLFLTIKLVLTSPKLFFSVMPVGGGLAKPLTFTILLTMAQGFIQYFWSITGLSSYMDSAGLDQIGDVADPTNPILMLLFMPAFIAAGQFIVTGIYHLLLILMRSDNAGFEGTFRALAYSNTPIILGLFPMPIREVEIGWMLITAVWGLFLTILGLKYIHKTSFAKVVPVCLVPLLLAMILGLSVFQSQLPTI